MIISNLFHHELIDLYIKILRKLNFTIQEYNNGTKYSIYVWNKYFLTFDVKRMFLPNNYFSSLPEDNKSSEIMFNPFGEDECNCSFLVLNDGINSELLKFVNIIFIKVIKKKININSEINSLYTFDNKCISELPSINKYTRHKWINIYNVISSNSFSKDIISFSFEYSDNSQSAQVKFDYPLYNYLLQLQDNTIFGIKLSDSEIELFIKIYEIFIINILEEAFIKPIKVSINSDKFSKFYVFVKFYLVITEQLYKEDNNFFWKSRLNWIKEIEKKIENLNFFVYDELDTNFIERFEKIKELDKEAYKNELIIRNETNPNLFLLKDSIMAKKQNLITQEEINKKFEREYLNTYYQKLASYFGRKDAEEEIFNREYMKNSLDFQTILHMQRLALQIIESDGGLLFFDTRNKKYYFRSDSENNIIPYDKNDILVILNRAMQKNLPKYHIYNQDSSFHSIEVALIENLNDVLKEKLKNEIKTSYTTKIFIFTNQIPSIDGEVFDLSRNEEIFQSETDLLYKINRFVPTDFLKKRKEYNKDNNFNGSNLYIPNRFNRYENEIESKKDVLITESFIKKFIYQMVNEDAEKSDNIINWLAYYFQNLKKTGTALVLLGDSEVTEKLFWNVIIKKIFGNKYCSAINDNEYKTTLLQDIAKYKLFFNITDIKNAGTKFDDDTLALLVKDLLIQSSVEYTNDKGEEEKVKIHGQLLVTATNPAPYLKKSFSKCTVIDTVNIDKIMESLDIEDETELEDKILKDLEQFSDLLNNYDVKDEIATEKFITKEREKLKGITTPNVDKEAIKDSIDKFIEAIKNKDIEYFTKLKDISDVTIYQHLKNAFDNGYFIGQDILHYYNAVNEQKFDKKKDLMDRLKAKDNMFSQEVKTLKILTSDGKEEVLFQAYKTSKETGNKELYKINDYLIAKDIKIPYGAVITTSQDNIEKYYHSDLENAIKINKEYKDKKAQEKENK